MFVTLYAILGLNASIEETCMRELVGTFKRLYEDETGSPFP